MIELWPQNDMKRHLMLLRLVALVVIFFWLLETRVHAPTHQSQPSTESQTPKPPKVNFLVRAQSPAPKAAAPSKTPVEAPPAKTEKPPTTQAGRMDKGEDLPALDLDIDARTLHWLAVNGQVLVLARHGNSVWKVLPGPHGFGRYRLERYRASDASRLSSRAILLHESNPWGIDLADIRSRLAALSPSAHWQFEIRLGADLDRQIASRQRAAISEHMTLAATRIRIRLKDGRVAIQATGG